MGRARQGRAGKTRAEQEGKAAMVGGLVRLGGGHGRSLERPMQMVSGALGSFGIRVRV